MDINSKSPSVKPQPSRRQIQRSCCLQEKLFTWALLGSSGVTQEGAAEPHPHPASVPTPTSCSSSGTRRPPLPSLDFPRPKADSFPPGFSLGRSPAALGQKCHQPLPCPQQLQLLSQAWLGMERCSWHRKSSPEPAFGYQPWVWFEILLENITTSSGRAFLTSQTLEKAPSQRGQPFLPSSSSAHLPGEAQAAAP